MKKEFRALKYIFLLSAFLFAFNLKAQDQVGDVFKGTPEDASKLTQAYLSPLFTGLGTGINSGWFNSAKTKKTLRFELRVSGTMAFVPSSDKTFDVNKLGLKSMAPAPGSNPMSPTFSGEDRSGTTMRLNGVNNASGDFNLPNGVDVGYVPAPQLQLTVGLPKHIDLSLRYVPTIDFKDYGKVDMFGAGAKVEVLPLIMGKSENLIPVDLAIALGFTQLNYNLPLEVGSNPNSNQQLKAKVKGMSADAVISKTLAIFTPFVSLGFQKSESKLEALGTYEFDVPVTLATPTGKQTFNNPFAFSQTDVSGARASVGFQLNLSFFRLYASYTQARYSYANAGVGFGFGK